MMVDETAVGASLLRIQMDEASEADVLVVLRQLAKHHELRQRCPTLGLMTKHLSEPKRRELADAMTCILFLRVEPAEPPDPLSAWAAPDDAGLWIGTTYAFISMSCPTPGSAWREHVRAKYRKNGTAEWAKLSPYAAEIVWALEAMWNVGGYLVLPQKTPGA